MREFRLVVFQNIDSLWYWKLVDPGKYWSAVAISANGYTRKSDAKRGASRFEWRLYETYYVPQEDGTAEPGAISIEYDV